MSELWFCTINGRAPHEAHYGDSALEAACEHFEMHAKKSDSDEIIVECHYPRGPNEDKPPLRVLVSKKTVGKLLEE